MRNQLLRIHLLCLVLATGLWASTENNRTSTNGLDTVPANWSLSHYPTTGDSVTYNGTTAGALDTIPAVIKFSYDCINIDSNYTGKYWSLQTNTDTNYIAKSVFIKPGGTFNPGSGVWCQTGDYPFTMANYSGTYTVSNMKLILQGTGTATFSKSTGLMFAYLSMGYPSKTTTFINNSGSQAGAANITIGTGTVSLPSGSYLYWAPLAVGDSFVTAGTNSTFSGAGRIYIIFQNSTAMTYYLPLATYNQTASWVIRKYSNTGAATLIIPNRLAATPTVQIYNQSASSSLYVRVDSTILGNGGFYFGASNASAVARLALNGDTLLCNDNFDLSTYNTGTSYDSLKACKIIVYYGVSIGSNQSIIPATSEIIIKDIAANTVNLKYKHVLNKLTVANNSGIKTTVTDSLRTQSDVSFSSGRLQWSGFDSIGGNWTNTSTDSLIRAAGGTMLIAGNMVSTGTGVRKNDGGAWIGFVGAGKTHNLTAPALSGANSRLGILRILDGGTLQQLSAARMLICNDSSGTWYTNGYLLVVDSILKLKDTFALPAADTLIDSGNTIVGAAFKSGVLGYIRLLGNNTDTVTGTGTAARYSLGKLEVRKGAGVISAQNGSIRALSFTLQTGSWRAVNATDTVRTGVAIDSTVDSTYIPVLVADSVYLRHAKKKISKIILSVCNGLDTAGYGGPALAVYHPTIAAMDHLKVSDTVGVTYTHARSLTPACAYMYVDSAAATSGIMPPGMALTKTGASAGAVSGTPTAPGTYIYTVSMYYNYGTTKSEDDTVVVISLSGFLPPQNLNLGIGLGF